MIRIRRPDQARLIDDSAIRRLVEQRFIEICNGELYDPEVHGEMIVVVPGDTVRIVSSARALDPAVSPGEGGRR